MAYDRVKQYIEIALIELEYLSADAHVDQGSESADGESRKVMSYFQAACKALEVSLDAIEQAKQMQKTPLVA